MDLNEITYYIDYHLSNPLSANWLIETIKEKVNSLAYMPLRFMEVQDKPGIHRIPVRKYNIYYSVDVINRTVTILRVLYGGKNIDNVAIQEN